MINAIKELSQCEFIKLAIFTTKSMLVLASLASVGAYAMEATPPPHGYERLALSSNNVTIDSNYFKDKSTSFVYDHYANAIFDFAGVDDVSVTEKRLIDIEVDISGYKPKQELSLSGIWIDNEGFYKQESWLTMALTADEVNNLLPRREFIPLDIERYRLNGQTLFAVIWQRNVHEVNWEVRYFADTPQIFKKIDEGYRIVEFDQYRHRFNDDPALAYQLFDVILVENSGDNYLNATWRVLEIEPGGASTYIIDPSDPGPYFEWPGIFPIFPDFTTWGFNQYKGFFLNSDESIIDIEFIEFLNPDPVFPHTWALVISHPIGTCDNKIAQSRLSFGEGVSSYEAQDDWGRVVDLEGTRPLGPWKNGTWYGPINGLNSFTNGYNSTVHACPY